MQQGMSDQPLPRIPDALRELTVLAQDLFWTWSHAGDALWARLEPTLWKRLRNPWTILATISSERLEALADDDAFRADMHRLAEERRQYLEHSGWFRSHPGCYRMHPDNLPCLRAFGIDCCVLANNHVLDWGRVGLLATLDALGATGLRIAGAGRSEAEAWAPAVLALPDKGRALVFAAALPSSGVPRQWAAGAGSPGVAFIDDVSPQNAAAVAAHIDRHRQGDDVVIVSLHWGANWGYEVSPQERAFAQSLIAEAGADIVHGHSSHHPKGIEVHHGKPIFYGCGDFLNDYEGISGYESYRGDLSLLYLVTLNRSDRSCQAVEMRPFRIRRFRLETATAEEAHWLQQRMDRKCRRFGGGVTLRDGRLVLSWRDVAS
jgi:poly-gamma-glutamate synthesis protein (capsule biosynthesis protein)